MKSNNEILKEICDEAMKIAKKSRYKFNEINTNNNPVKIETYDIIIDNKKEE